jgi:dUTP pyrophosphatase
MPQTLLPVQVKIVDPRLREFGGAPRPATGGSAAVDVVALGAYRRKPDGKPDMTSREPIADKIVIAPGEVCFVGLGFAMHIGDPGYAAFLMPRSGMGSALGIVMANTVGLIDSDYQNEVVAALWNRNFPATGEPLRVSLAGDPPLPRGAVEIRAGDRVAQMYLAPVVLPEWREVEEFGRVTERGLGGFGSTGA